MNVTRWAELGDSVRMATEITTALGARTDFNLLNATPAGQFFTVGFDERIGIPPNTLCDEAGMSKVMSESPCGRTPLTQAVQAIIAAVAPVAHKLQASGQQVAVIIATDGLPDDSNSFLAALQQLQQLPVWIVVRLCTDDVRSHSMLCVCPLMLSLTCSYASPAGRKPWWNIGALLISSWKHLWKCWMT